MTREIYKKLPYFKPSTEAVHNWCYGLGISAAISSFAVRILRGTVSCAMAKDWQTNFFPTASTCFIKSIQDLNDPTSKFFTYWNLTISGLLGIGCCIAARILLRDSRESTRFSLLHKEYASIAEVLIEFDEKAKSSKNPEAIATVNEAAQKLKRNLPIIETHLKSVRLNPQQEVELMNLLRYAVKQVLGGTR